ncbi:hypothetical protein BC833DRAFT_588837 [Globomyces pollinis-pini]|nr:hypothetical protein BC833DRAFT_588837 [Globomyces pollinis-pini]
MMKTTPGQLLGNLNEYEASSGTFVRDNFIYASVIGVKTIKDKALSVVCDKPPVVTPTVGSVVTGKVIRINPRFAVLSIMVVGNIPTQEEFQGVINTKDVRVTKVDTVDIYKCFRPGDIVHAKVISMGDSRSYQLSTNENEYGVVLAQSMAGHTMVPISWDQMMCPKTKMVEYRKCAKPQESN